jgi:hypothetical protein
VNRFGEHPKDTHRLCAFGCGGQPHVFNGTWIQAGLSDDMTEVHFFTCCACDARLGVPGAERPDLDGEAHGWVVERRAPAEAPAESQVRETVRPGAAWVAA